MINQLSSTNPFLWIIGIKISWIGGLGKANLCNRIAEKKDGGIFYGYHIDNESFVTKRWYGQSRRIADVIGRYIVLIKKPHFPKNLSLGWFRIVVDCANWSILSCCTNHI